MGAFLNALSFLAPIAPAQAEAREIRRQRGMENQSFTQDMADRQQQARQREEQIKLDQQKVRTGNQPVIFGEPEWEPSKGAWTALAMDPVKGITRVPVPGGENPLESKSRQYREAVQAYKTVTGKEPSPEMQNALFASSYGVKLPSTYGRLGQRFTDPSTGMQWERSIGEDGMEHVEPVVGPDGNQLGGLRPGFETDATRMEMKQDENGNWVKIPVESHTVRKPIGSAGPTPTARPSGGVPSGLPRSTGVIPTGVHGKLSSQDAGLMQSSQEIQSAANDVLPLLAKAKGRNGVMDRLAAERAWLEYKAGFTPSDPLYAQIIKPVALLAGIGSSQWTRVGRGKYLFDRISQHLPKPSDTPALLYDKINWLANNVSMETQRAVMQPVPSSFGQPSATPGMVNTPPPGAKVRDWTDLH